MKICYDHVIFKIKEIIRLSLADPLIPDWMLQIIIASISATISGIILLLIHHSRVKQELEIHRQKEVFERKQKMYRSFVSNFMKTVDLAGNPSHDFANWRIGHYLYNELMFVASKPVIQAFNRYLESGVSSDSDLDFTNKTKDVLVAIRKDLYGEDLTRDQVKFIGPSQDLNKSLQLIEQHYSVLAKHNLTNLHNISPTEM